jgi:hypothetical protein
MKLKECLLAELKPADGTSDVTASGEAYDQNLQKYKLFGKCLAWDKSRKMLHAQYAAVLLQGQNHSVNSCCNFQNRIMRQPQQTGSAHSIVSSNITISGKRTFPTMIVIIVVRGH